MDVEWILPRGRALAAVLLSALMVVSCTSFRPVRLDDIRDNLKEGDRIRVVTKDGKKSTLTIVALTNDSIFAKDQVMEFREIASIEKSEPETGKIVVAAVLVVGLVALLVLSASHQPYQLNFRGP